MCAVCFPGKRTFRHTGHGAWLDFVVLCRCWEDAGGLWRVLDRAGGSVTVGLYRRDGGEETDRFVATDPRLTQFFGRAHQ